MEHVDESKQVPAVNQMARTVRTSVPREGIRLEASVSCTTRGSRIPPDGRAAFLEDDLGRIEIVQPGAADELDPDRHVHGI